MNKKCPRCERIMIQIADSQNPIGENSVLENKWECCYCGYVKVESYWDIQMKKHYGS